MIIISKHTNQLCNRLFTYLPILSYALEANQKVQFLFQYKGYNNFFPNLEKAGYRSRLTDSSINASLTSKVFNALVSAADKCVHLILKPGEQLPLRQPLGVLFNPKWRDIRYDKAYIAKHANTLRQLFAPNEATANAVSQMFGTSQAVTVGVHMRGGDYRTYKGGIYYYTPEQYRHFMLQIKNELEAAGKQVRFLICSNEKVDKSAFADFDIFMQNGTDMLVDLYGLAQCQYIMGPPSTYSQWASFYGQTPYLELSNAQKQVALQAFRIITHLDSHKE